MTPTSLRLISLVLGAPGLIGGTAQAARQFEALGRGLVGINMGDGTVSLSWRMLSTDPDDIAFNLYRTAGGGDPVRVNADPLSATTHFIDRGASAPAAWFVRAVRNGVESEPTPPFQLAAGAPARPWITVPIESPAGYAPNDASVGDLDGDGDYEILLHQVGRGRDNSQAGLTTAPVFQAYRLDGTRLWTINLGRNIREGAHYTQFIVYDLDGDGRAEFVCKTADGTVDGTSRVIGDADADWRGKTGRTEGKVLDGPEFLTVFDGLTGAAMATTDFVPPRGEVAAWGDDYGNRCDRFLACAAYLDGERPSVVMGRGYYTRSVLVAWDWRDGRLTRRWTFDSDAEPSGNRAYRGQGNHGISVGDVDGDGRDDIIHGACVIGSDGRGMYSTGSGHGDAMHFSDLDPERPGLEVFKANGDRSHPAGLELRDARTGGRIFGVASTGRRGVVRACALDLDPRHSGAEMWGKGEGVAGLFDARGTRISDASPRICNMGIWWDGDLLRELLDGVTIAKWDWEQSIERRIFSGADHGVVANNGSKSNPCLCADILGDWREEVIARTPDGSELRIFVSTIATAHRFRTLMHDPIYRLGVAWQNVAYNQPAHTGFFLGHNMKPPPTPPMATPAGPAPATGQ